MNLPKSPGRGASAIEPPALVKDTCLPTPQAPGLQAGQTAASGPSEAQGNPAPARHTVTTRVDDRGRYVRTCDVDGVIALIWTPRPPGDLPCPFAAALMVIP